MSRLRNNQPAWGDRDEFRRHWNGQRWVTHREWQIALRMVAYAEWRSLPWYRRIFTPNPNRRR